MVEAFTRHRDRPHAARVVGSEPAAHAAIEPRGARDLRAHDRHRQSRRGGVSGDRRECVCSRASARTITTSARSRSHSTSSKISRRDAIRTTCSRPVASAQIIRDHVRDGLELADEYKLPRALRAFITEHHGTGTITYFLDKARQREGQAHERGGVHVPRAAATDARKRPS